MLIYTPRQIVETLYFSLECVDALQDKGLKCVFYSILHQIFGVFQECVDMVAETLAGTALLGEVFTD